MAMRVLIAGAGAIGGYFGARLAAAGRDVTFLVRGARAERLRADGLQITGQDRDFTVRDPQLITTAEIAAPYDVVLLAVKAFALDAALGDLAVAVGSETMIVPVLNGMRHLDVLAQRFGERTVLGGLCVISSTIDARGRIVMLSPSHDLTYGELTGELSERVRALDALMQNAGFNARASASILPEMWQKWVMLATVGAITCLMRGTIGDIVPVPGGTELASAMLDEVTAIAAAAGYPMNEAFVTRARTSNSTPGSTLASSMYRDLQSGNDVEADQILGDLVERARGFGLATPLLAAAYTHLKVYQRGRPLLR
jgi:2-dehydropantoate 2-reductase